MDARRAEIWIKGLSCLVLAVLILRDRARAMPRPQARPWLLGAGLLAWLAWFNAGAFHFPKFLHTYEHFHYQLGSRYFAELGYDGLYAASLYHQVTTRPGSTIERFSRDLRTNEMVSSREVFQYGALVHQRFSPERWQAFAADHDYYLDALSQPTLERIRRDHGYNPSPTWTATAQLVDVGATDRAALVRLGLLDPLLLLALFGLVFHTYGSRATCLCLVVFGLGYAWRYDWIGGAFLRLDWLVAVGCAVCCVRLERYRTAGALLAYAGMVRIFPFGFLFGPAVLALRALVRRESIGWVLRLGQGLLLGGTLCFAAGALTGRGIDAWPEFAANLDKHRETFLTNNVGLLNTVLYDLDVMRRVDVDFALAEPWLAVQKKIASLAAERRPWIIALQATLLALLGAACWRARRDESLVLGIGVVFVMTLLTCYYWIMLLLVPLSLPIAGTVALLLLSAGLWGLHVATPAFETIYGAMSWALALLLPGWIALVWRRREASAVTVRGPAR
jgi:hypothetical protein